MSEMQSALAEYETEKFHQPRRRGAPAGNRNAFRHGGYSAAAREARAAHRAAIVRNATAGRESFPTDKRNNSVARGTDAQRSPGRKRGAPKGNTNALKHGNRSAEMRAFRADLRRFIAQARLH